MKRFILVLVCLFTSMTLARANGTLNGTVIDSATSAPVEGALVTMLGRNTNITYEVLTDVSGGFNQSLPPDFYFASVYADNYVPQLYDQISCVGYCAINQGTPILITEGATRTIDFPLEPAGAIGGIVTGTGGQPLQGLTVQIDLDSAYMADVQTDSQGRFLVGRLPPNPGYRAFVWSYDGIYLNEVYDHVPCEAFCDPEAGTPIPVTAGATTEADFALTAGGTISGSVSGSGGELGGVFIDIFDSRGVYLTAAQTHGSGLFTTRGLAAGTYFAETTNTWGYVDEVYADRPCPNDCFGACDPTAGTPIAVTLGSDTPGIHFDLAAGGGLSGTITDSRTSAPVYQAYVQIFDIYGLPAGYGTTDASGNYSVGGLFPGTYFVDVSPGPPYFGQVYDGVSCAPSICPPTTGTPVNVAADSITTGIDVHLIRGGSIQGTFSDSQDGSGVSATVNVYDSNKNEFSGSVSSVDNTFSVQLLKEGTYYLIARCFDQVHLDRVYGGSSCVADSCDLSAATTVSVTAGGTTSVAFSLDRGGTIGGTITDAGTSYPLDTVSVFAYDTLGREVSISSYNWNGSYSTRALPAGSYFVLTRGRTDYVDQVYPGIPCLYGSCDPTIGTPVQVTPENTTTINFQLAQGLSISGNITDAASGLPVRYAIIYVFDSSGRRVSFATSYPLGTYHAGGLIPGTYYVLAYDTFGNYGEYAGQVYDGIPCARTYCDIQSGTPVTVVAGSDTAGIDFALHRGGYISGAVTDARNGFGIAGATVIILDANWNVVSRGYTDCSGAYTTTTNLPTGVYFAVTLSDLDYIEQRYRDASCKDLLACDATAGEGIAVTLGAETTGVNFKLRPANTVLFVDDFEDEMLAPDWAYMRGSWQEAAGVLNGQNGTAVAAPAFDGCSQCTVEGVLNAGGRSASLLGWYRDRKNNVELMMDTERDRWILRQRIHGAVVAKAKVRRPVDTNTNYRATIAFDGSQFHVSVDGALLFSMPAVGAPSGTAGFQLRSGSGTFGEILVY